MTASPGVATLARLMQSGPMQFINPALLADTSETISGGLDIDTMPRLTQLLSSTDATVNFSLRFARDEQRRIVIHGHFSTRLAMQCQRCLEAVDVDLDRDVEVMLVASEDEAGRVPRRVEPLVLEGRDLSLCGFMEDELLLALPMSPSHETAQCHGETVAGPALAENRQHPFTVLKDLKLKKTKN